MRYLFILLTVLAGTTASFYAVAFSVCLFLWHNIFRPQEFAYRDGSLPLPMYVLGVFAMSYLLNLARGKLRPKWNKFLTISVLFMGWIFITALTSKYFEAHDGFIEILKYLLPVFLISTAIQSKIDVEMVLFTLMISVGIWGSQAGVKGLLDGVTPTVGIRGGQMTDNNDFMVAVVSTIPMFVYFAFNYAWRFKLPVRFIMGCMLFLSLSGIVFSNSRGATVGLVGMLMIYLILITKRRIRDTFLLGLALFIAYHFLPEAYFDRLSTIEVGATQTEASAASRVELAKAAFRGTMDNPIFGVGPKCWLPASLNYGQNDSEPHNVWLKCSVETGIPGLVFFLTIIAITVLGILKVRRHAIKNNNRNSANLATALAMAVFGFLLPSTFVSHPFSEFLWSLFAITNGYSHHYLLNNRKTHKALGRPTLGYPSDKT